MINILRTSIIPIFLLSLYACSDTKSKELASNMAFVDSLMARMTLEEKLGRALAEHSLVTRESKWLRF